VYVGTLPFLSLSFFNRSRSTTWTDHIGKGCITMDLNASRKHYSLKYFFLLIFVLSVPLWLAGGTKLPLPVKLPFSALTAFVPAVAALILSFRANGLDGIKGLFQISRENKVWSVPVLLLAPFIYILSFVFMRLLGLPLPDNIYIPFLWLLVFSVIYLITGVGEELGWSGYATPLMQERYGAFRAGLILGIVWALWHSIAFVQKGSPIEWVAWQSMKTVAMRMIIVWIYNRTGKGVLAAILYHATDNVSWSLFPNLSSHYDPAATGLINWAMVLIIIFAGGFKSSHRHRWQI
jgi:membrane protease YdiL (CAAX protease family)